MVVRRALIALSLVLGAFAAGCGEDDGGTDRGSPSLAPSGTPVSASPAAAAGPPQGVYRTEPLTAADLVDAATAAGYPETKAEQLAGHYTGTVVFELLITADTLTQREIVDDGAPQEGSRADYVVTDSDTLVTTDPCSRTTFDFALAGNLLTLDLVDSVVTGCDIPEDDIIIGTMIFESGPFVLQDASAQATADQGVGGSQVADPFVVPFTIQLADWLDPGSVETEKQFVTWQSADEQRALRVLAPVSVYRPASTTESPPPSDFSAYVLSLADSGATMTDRVETKVDGRDAVEVTVGLPTGAPSLDGALGCPEAGLAAEDCFGPQDELVLRMVVVDVAGTPVLIWERDFADQAGSVDYASFDEMVASVRFS